VFGFAQVLETSQIAFSIPSKIEEISPAVDKLVEAAKSLGFPAENQADMEIAAFEALANAVIHGNQQDASKQVHILCKCEAGIDVSIVVRDEGPGFNPQSIPDPTAKENIESEHGRGILMMRAFMDDVRYEAGGTEVHMRKRIRGR
jgi:serine/threonine-protein kinase RsbW